MKARADQLLVTRGLVENRTKAQALILAGKVFSGERRITKAGDLLAEATSLEVRGQDHPWVLARRFETDARAGAFRVLAGWTHLP